ncbi:ATP-binding protein [Kaarinaea lacus]
MERESDNRNQLLQRIFLSLSKDQEQAYPADSQDFIEHLREENDALRKTLRMHNGLRQRFEQLYDSSPIGYLTIDGSGCIVEANLMIASLFGIQRSWLIGQNLDHYIDDTDYHLFTRHLDYVRNTNGAEGWRHHIVNHKGERVNVRMESVQGHGERQHPYSTIYSSITVFEQATGYERLPEAQTDSRVAGLKTENENLKKKIKHLKGTESALLQYHDELEKLIKRQSKEIESLKNQLAAEMNSRKQAEKKAGRDQEYFAQASRLNSVVELATGLAHEINQPLSAITTYSQSCLRKLQSNENPQRLQALLEQIQVQTKRATQIIRHLRDFISKGDTHREITNINKVIQYAINVLRKDIIDNEIKIHMKQPRPVPQIMADPIQIEQVILNLLQNAVDALKKVPPPKRELELEVRGSQTHIFVTVHDTGPGITHQNEDKIIKPFFTTKTDGMGLGLAISRAIALDHGGQLTHQKDTRKGATFQVSLAIDGRNKSEDNPD